MTPRQQYEQAYRALRAAEGLPGRSDRVFRTKQMYISDYGFPPHIIFAAERSLIDAHHRSQWKSQLRSVAVARRDQKRRDAALPRTRRRKGVRS